MFDIVLYSLLLFVAGATLYYWSHEREQNKHIKKLDERLEKLKDLIETHLKVHAREEMK